MSFIEEEECPLRVERRKREREIAERLLHEADEFAAHIPGNEPKDISVTDHSLCGSPDRLPQCSACWRNPALHPYAQNDYLQVWHLFQITGSRCDGFVEMPKEARK